LVPDEEFEFVDLMLENDAKNYHAWSYRYRKLIRTMLVKKHGWRDVSRWIEEDVRNNSAWHHLYQATLENGNFDETLNYALEKVKVTPENESVWNVISGILKETKRTVVDIDGLKDYCISLGNRFSLLCLLSDPSANRMEILQKLIEIDPVRTKYYQFLKK
jgi:protein farnesyltransferase/geranylgeranyltransferase type-1 subunit alpha